MFEIFSLPSGDLNWGTFYLPTIPVQEEIVMGNIHFLAEIEKISLISLLSYSKHRVSLV